MTDYYKIIDNNYIVGFGTNGSDDVTEITEHEYEELRDVFSARPVPEPGYDYRLKTDFTWELYEMEDDDLTDEEVFDILTGGTE